jgi:HK97 family phage prohead protease
MSASGEIERRYSQDRAMVDRSDGRRVRGNAIVFNSLSIVMVNRGIGRFRERIRPDAVDRTMRSGAAVKALWNHNSDLVLGNTRAGTLLLRKTASALAIEITPPLWADPQLETIQRGDVDGMSFSFSVPDGGDTWEFNTEDGIPIRDVADMTFSEVSVVAFPAYGATDVAVSQRSIEAFTEYHGKHSRKYWEDQHRSRLAL